MRIRYILCMDIKVCPCCGIEFSGKRIDAIYCTITCAQRIRGRRYEAKHPDKVRENRWRQNGVVERRIYSRIKSRAKKSGIPFDIEIDDVRVPDICPVLGIPIVKHQGIAGYAPDSPSMDKLIPKLGYVKGNVRVISARANLLKNDASIEELELVLRDLRNIHGKT